jgi:signal transduction histidine kinase
MAKVESGILDLEEVPFSMESSLQKLRSLNSAACGVRDIQLTLATGPISPLMVGDITRLEQVLQNLLHNAVKFTPRDGHVMLTVEAVSEKTKWLTTPFVGSPITKANNSRRLSSSIPLQPRHSPSSKPCTPEGPKTSIPERKANSSPSSTKGGRVVLLFRCGDTGSGIPLDRIGSLFQPFAQLTSTLRPSEAGTGLGLCIARTFANHMSGTLNVWSDPPPPPPHSPELGPWNDNKTKMRSPTAAGSFAANSMSIGATASTSQTIASCTAIGLNNLWAQGKFSTIFELAIPFGLPSARLRVSMKSQNVAVSRLLAPNNATKRASLSILVVDDNEVNWKLLTRVLTMKGFTQIEVATNGQIAIDMTKAKLHSMPPPVFTTSIHPFDLILMDQDMPGRLTIRIVPPEAFSLFLFSSVFVFFGLYFYA